jgi:GDP-mannose 6-dehydrogenase
MTNISIFGIGYVGVVSAACLASDGHQVLAVDIDPSKVHKINSGEAPIVEAELDQLIAKTVQLGLLSATSDIRKAVETTDISFVCVGTPSDPDGGVGLAYVKQACIAIGKAIAQKGRYHSVVIRSTIVPGTTEAICIPLIEEASGLKAGVDFGVGYYPEFLREGTAIQDNYDPGLIVFGALDETTLDHLKHINKDLPCQMSIVPLATAELIKYTSNSWRATKVTFANEIGNIAKAMGIDGQQVMRVLCSDAKVNMSSYFMRPGFAFGGSCLPKDVRALRHLATAKSTSTPLLDAVLLANGRQIERAEAMVENAGGKSVGMIGISFKAGTDDLRESPLAELAARLIAKGYGLKVYDPNVSQAYSHQMTGSGRGNNSIPDLQSRLVDNIEDLINASDVILVGNCYDETVDTLSHTIHQKPVVDLARVPGRFRSNGQYEGICW